MVHFDGFAIFNVADSGARFTIAHLVCLCYADGIRPCGPRPTEFIIVADVLV
jgi:hypothetical protein